MKENFGAEIPDVEAEHLAAAHDLVAARRGEHPAGLLQSHAAGFRDSPRQIGVFAVELDPRVESADGCECLAGHREIASVEHGAKAEYVLRQQVRGRREAVVVHPDEHSADEIPVVKPIRPGHGDGRSRTFEFARDLPQPIARRTAVGINVDEHVAGGHLASCLAGDDEALSRLVHDADTGNGGNRRCAVRAGIVDDDDFERRERLLKQ